jgi:DUF1680 family protein
VNLYIGSTVNVDLSGTSVQIKQTTDYPRSGHVELSIDPGAARRFALYVRVPDRGVSRLYQDFPAVRDIDSISVNGVRVEPAISDGYIRIERQWAPGDKIVMDLPMVIQRIRADDRVAADRGRVALQYGPLVYTVESVDQNVEAILPPTAELHAQWEPNLLRGVTAIHGTFADGSKLTAIPYYARNNRGGRSMVWIAEK